MTLDDAAVELCLCDGPLEADEVRDPFVSRLGGQPAWLADPVPADDLRCGRCGAALFLVLQLDAPLEDLPDTDRVLYVFACNTRACTEAPDRDASGAVRALVQHAAAAPAQPSGARPSFFDDLMAGGVAGGVASLSISGAHRVVKEKSGAAPVHPAAFPGVRLRIVDELVQTGAEKRPAVDVGAAEPGEGYERMDLPGVDRHIRAFTRRVAHYPHQVARYAPCGGPLLFCAPGAAIPPCECCGGQPTFDAQVMPAALVKLPVAAHTAHVRPCDRAASALQADAMEWGTILVYTCKRADCSRAVVRVQIEEDCGFSCL